MDGCLHGLKPYMSTCQKETIAYTVLLYEVSICLTEKVAININIMNGKRYRILFIRSRRLFIDSDGLLRFFCRRKNTLTPSKR